MSNQICPGQVPVRSGSGFRGPRKGPGQVSTRGLRLAAAGRRSSSAVAAVLFALLGLGGGLAGQFLQRAGGTRRCPGDAGLPDGDGLTDDRGRFPGADGAGRLLLAIDDEPFDSRMSETIRIV